MIRKPAFVILPALLMLAAAPHAIADSGEEAGLDGAAASVRGDLQGSIEELAALRKRIAAEKLPLSRKMSDLESELRSLRGELQDVSRILDTRSLDVSTLGSELKSRRDEKTYLSSLLDEYRRNLETHLHITELQRYRDVLDEARLALDLSDRDPQTAFEAQAAMVEGSLDRLLDLLGGATFEGKAVAEDGLVRDVTFALVGPVALYRTSDGASAGLAEQRLGSLEPNMIPLEQPELTTAAGALVASGSGELPFDPSLGNAQAIEEVQDTLGEHVRKGGVVMVPILLLAAAALLVSLAKWVQLIRIPKPAQRGIAALFGTLQKADLADAAGKAKEISGPTGDMLRAAVDHIHEPKSLVEEVMFEKTLETRLRLQSFLPFVAVAAAAAPLLGLLGTVTGIINTFKLITVFGTGDAKTLSSGISEALITTEFGLIVAIPSLLLHAYLSRKARRILNGMEKTAVSFLNRIPAAPLIGPVLDAAGVGGTSVAVPGLSPASSAARPEPTDH